jgi:hypothetical protein
VDGSESSKTQPGDVGVGVVVATAADMGPVELPYSSCARLE